MGIRHARDPFYLGWLAPRFKAASGTPFSLWIALALSPLPSPHD